MDGVGTSQEEGSYFTPLLISMAGITATAVALVLYHFLLVRCCLRRGPVGRRGGLLSSGRSLRRRRPPPAAPGLADHVLEAIPILCYSTAQKEEAACGQPFRVDQSECVVCLGELEDGDKVRLLPSCRHAFHVLCIDEWFSAHTNCPVCRSPVTVGNSAMQDRDDDEGIRAADHGVMGNTTTSRIGDREGGGGARNPASFSSNGFLLRHCVSMALPVQDKKLCDDGKELKRSLSMDQSHFVINILKEPQTDEIPSSSSSSSKAVLLGTRSLRTGSVTMNKFDRVSSMITRSFSQLRIGRSGTRADVNLP